MEMRRRYPYLMLLLLLLLWQGGAVAAGELVVVANHQVTSERLSERDLLELFSLRQGQWPDGQPVRVLALTKDHPLHLRFCRDLLKLASYRLDWFWSRHLYAGLGRAPQRFESVEALLAALAATPGAIGYLQQEDLNDQVKALVVE